MIEKNRIVAVSETKKEPNLTSNIIINSIGIILLRCVGIITAPIMTKYISPEQYGSVVTYTTLLSFMGIFVGLQANSTLKNAELDLGNEKIKAYHSSIMFLSFLSFVLVFVPFVLFNKFFERILLIEEGFGIFMFPSCFFSYCVSFLSSKFIVEKKAFKNLMLNIAMTIITSSMAIFLVITLKENPQRGLIWSSIVPNFMVGSVVFFYFIIKGKTIVNIGYWKYCLKISVPLIFHVASSIILAQSDRLMIRYFLGEELTGLYGYTYGFSAIIFTVWSALNQSWVPYYYEYLHTGDYVILQKCVKNFNFTFLCLAIGFMLVCPEFLKFLTNSRYWGYMHIIPPIVLAAYFNHLYGYSTNYEAYKKKTTWIALGTIGSAIINVIFNYFMIPLWGGLGAAGSTAISYLMLFVFHECIARYKIGSFFIRRSFYLPGIIIMVLCCGLFYICFDQWIFRWVVAAITGVVLLVKVIKQKSII